MDRGSGRKRLSKNLLDMKNKDTRTSSTGVTFVRQDDSSSNPECTHGPTLLFSRETRPGATRRFFSCSAFRDRKYCDFFHWEDEKITEGKRVRWRENVRAKRPKVKHTELFSRVNSVLAADESKRFFCHDCCFLGCGQKEIKDHKEHDTTTPLTEEMIHNPSTLLRQLNTNKKEAQFHFTKSSKEVILQNLRDNGRTAVLCIGAPTIHEAIRNGDSDMQSLLLDFDHRLASFYGPLEFCWYNMCNHFFFHGDSSRNVYEDFLRSGKDRLVVVTDPPFGAKCDVLAACLERIERDWRRLTKQSRRLDVLWIFPYFMESQIKECMNHLNMSDYQVEYENHGSFRSGGRKQGSPVRIFTSLPLTNFVLPSSAGYKLCTKCSLWVCAANKHCDRCNACTSKNGSAYSHCDRCGRCVKASWQHCERCDRCALVEHPCDLFKGKKKRKMC